MQNDSYNRGGFYAFLFSMIFSLGFFVYLVFFLPGVNLKEVKEVAPVAQGADDVAKNDKPWVEDEAMVKHGAQVFSNNCAVCHGDKGMGDGPGGKGLNPPPRNFVEGKWKKGGTSEGLFEVITNGLPPSSMVGFNSLPVKDRWALVQFIRSITKNKVKDDPAKLEAFAKTAK